MTASRSRAARPRGRLTSAFGLGVLVAGLAVSPLAAAMHIGLASSVPAKGAHLMTPPTEIRLTFTGSIDVAKAAVELLSPGYAPVTLDPLRAVVDSPRVAVAKITGTMTGGPYIVKWKAVARDGAPGSGSFAFMIMPPSEPRE